MIARRASTSAPHVGRAPHVTSPPNVVSSSRTLPSRPTEPEDIAVFGVGRVRPDVRPSAPPPAAGTLREKPQEDATAPTAKQSWSAGSGSGCRVMRCLQWARVSIACIRTPSTVGIWAHGPRQSFGVEQAQFLAPLCVVLNKVDPEDGFEAAVSGPFLFDQKLVGAGLKPITPNNGKWPFEGHCRLARCTKCDGAPSKCTTCILQDPCSRPRRLNKTTVRSAWDRRSA
mgnify:CR=1 FL=1